ncbi:hypothetical protein M407DRAFT_28938 [Tulasnella calospora MUT 4182]|uniref:F-box domain-containing protein n=1 Tax=Tulasnella calospora MUT 4182 TaxID=1051891 RepID=A0A0C3QB41_9AGAM|nr:hypothetical protein M407DRAFT_28938 [Tulasnella calospora MUT 4182]
MHILDLPVEIFVPVLKLLASGDLLRCATVCSQWRDLTLDVKWRDHLVHWVDLLRVLGLVERSEEGGRQYHWVPEHCSIEDAIAGTGWRRLNELRKKISRLRIASRLMSEDIDYMLKLQHVVESPHRAFCPNLRELELSFGDLQPYEYDFLAGGSLRQFKLSWTSETEMRTRLFAGTMERVALRSPMIEHISVHRSDFALIDYGKFSNLRTLNHGGHFSATSWIKLCAGCPLLEDVNIWWIQGDLVDEEAIAEGPQMQQLPLLRILHIEIMRDRGRVLSPYILRTTNMPQLRVLKVDLRQLGSEEADGLLSRVRSRSPLITTLRVHGHTLEWGSFAWFGKLRQLDLYGRLSSWKIEDLERIIANLPNLAQLYIASNPDGGIDRSRPAFTPAIVETIARRCQLGELRIPLNALETPWMPEPPTTTAKFGKLVGLTLDPLHIEAKAVEPFAKYLAQLCPNVIHFEAALRHPQEIGQELELPRHPTGEEIGNGWVMKTLFFDAQRKDHVSG